MAIRKRSAASICRWLAATSSRCRRIENGIPALQLYCRDAAAELPLRGLSGAPVLVGTPERAVGIICWNPVDGDAAPLKGGQLFAVPVWALASDVSIAAACPEIAALVRATVGSDWNDLPDDKEETLSLLSWRTRLAPLTGQENQENALLAWAQSGRGPRARFLTGPGGWGEVPPRRRGCRDVAR